MWGMPRRPARRGSTPETRVDRAGRQGAGVGQAIALPATRPIAQNALMKIAVYMMGALAVIVVGSITWSTMLLNSH